MDRNNRHSRGSQCRGQSKSIADQLEDDLLGVGASNAEAQLIDQDMTGRNDH